MKFKNETQLKNFLMQKCRAAVAGTEQKVHSIIDKCLRQFYAQFDPDEYIRTEQLLHSLVKSEVKQVGSKFEAKVYFDVGSLNYQTGVVPTQSGTGYATWDGETVLKVAMEGSYPHGGYEKGTAIWTKSQAMIQTLGGVYEMLERELKTIGIPIKKE